MDTGYGSRILRCVLHGMVGGDEQDEYNKPQGHETISTFFRPKHQEEHTDTAKVDETINHHFYENQITISYFIHP